MPRLIPGKQIEAFLDLIAASEGTTDSPATRDDGYDVIVTGISGPNVFTDYSAHPFANGRPPILVRTAPTEIISTASGRYQIILPTWVSLAKARSLTTFSPQAQDIAAMQLLTENGALDLIDSGRIASAIEACNETWASFPGNSYGQGGRTLEWLLVKYTTLLATEA